MKKLVTLLLVMVMIFSLATTAFAAGTGSITITPPAGVNADATNTYKIYKVFDADGNGDSISYKLVEGKTTAPAGFTVDEAGNVAYAGGESATELTAADIAAIAAYVTEADLVATVTSTGSANAVANDLPNGYYYITTSTGSVVTIDTTNPNATVNDKNTVPEIKKEISDASSYDADGKKALAQVGTDVEFTATITVGKGSVNYVFHDTMSPGLQYNNDVTVTGVNADQYEVLATPADGDTITIKFADGIAEGTEITIKYTAKVTSDALTQDPAKNTAKVTYGDKYSTTSETTKVYNAKFTVTKTDGENKPLAGAGFVIKNADGKYYKLTDGVVAWVDSIDEATEYTSDAEGNVTSFTGLADGIYTLVEKTTPAGYNKAPDKEFTIAEGDYETKNLEQTATVINKAGTELPSTGGVGTTMFYIIGGLMMLMAVVLLVTKKRMAAAE